MKTFYEAIYEWAKTSGVENVGIDWTGLADHLSKTDIKPDELSGGTKWLAYDKYREFSLELDIKQVAESKGLTLEKWQVEAIKHRYYKLDDETWEQLSIIMDDMKGELNANHN